MPRADFVITDIPIDMIDTNPYQMRCYFNLKTMDELAQSIKEVGLIQPVAVRMKEDGRYQVIAGVRRLMAIRLCCETKIKAIVFFDVSDEMMIKMMCSEMFSTQ
jgi:ParB family chromosome partitioning protein